MSTPAEREGVLILREAKTQDRANPKLYSRRLGLELSDEIRASLQQHPRDYLFCIKIQSGKNLTTKPQLS
ncbi:hypothetical protein WJX77_002021 [Trebouxia sp. C0004]